MRGCVMNAQLVHIKEREFADEAVADVVEILVWLTFSDAMCVKVIVTVDLAVGCDFAWENFVTALAIRFVRPVVRMRVWFV